MSEHTQMPIAQLIKVSKSYPGVRALHNVDFSLYPGEIRALLGKNGAGKSTLIRMLTGTESPDSGFVTLSGTRLTGEDTSRTQCATRLGVKAVYQELSLVPQMSVMENLFLGEWPGSTWKIDQKQMEQEARSCLQTLGIELDLWQLAEQLSPAQQQLVEIARVLRGQPKLVILDEPTSSLASAEVEKVIQAVKRMAEAGIAILYVSHRMAEIRQLATTATIMRDGQIVANANVNNTSTEQIVEWMLGSTPAHFTAESTNQSNTEVVLQAQALTLLPKLHNINLALRAGEVLGIAGLLGSGRTELLKALCGLLPVQSGNIQLHGHTIHQPNYPAMLKRGMAYTPENRKDEGIVPALGVDENTVITNFRQVSKGGMLSWARIRQATLTIIKQLHVKVATTHTSIATLSGGNQQKVVMGRWVYAQSQILLLDEPTRGVDVEAKHQIYRLIRQLAAQGKSIIFVSSEAEELPLVCDRILLLQQGQLQSEFCSPFDTDALMTQLLTTH